MARRGREKGNPERKRDPIRGGVYIVDGKRVTWPPWDDTPKPTRRVIVISSAASNFDRTWPFIQADPHIHGTTPRHGLLSPAHQTIRSGRPSLGTRHRLTRADEDRPAGPRLRADLAEVQVLNTKLLQYLGLFDE